MPAWLVPTARAATWGPLTLVAGLLLFAAALGTAAHSWSPDLVSLAAAAVAGALVAGLHDHAAALLSAMPTPLAVRRARTLAVLAPVAAASWLAYLTAGHRVAPAQGWTVGPVVALTLTGLAVAWWAPDRFATAAGVAAPLAWFALARVAGDGPGILLAWAQHPWTVAVVALAGLILGRDR